MNSRIKLLAVLVFFCVSLNAEELKTYGFAGNVSGLDKRGGAASEMTLVLDYEGPAVSAMQFMIDLEGTGLRFVHSKNCMAGLPDTHKGDGALSACNVLEEGKRLMVIFTDLAGMEAIPNGILGSVKVAPSADKGGQLSRGAIRDLGIWGQDQSELAQSTDRSPILLSFD